MLHSKKLNLISMLTN